MALHNNSGTIVRYVLIKCIRPQITQKVQHLKRGWSSVEIQQWPRPRSGVGNGQRGGVCCIYLSQVSQQ